MADKKNKAKKNKAAHVDSKEQLTSLIRRFSETFAAHGVVIMFIVAGSMIGLALVRSRSYLNPLRDETRYTDTTSKNRYSKIDYKLVDKLEASLDKATIDVNQSLSPNRNNPFSE